MRFEFVSIVIGVESILEDSHDLMSPEFDDVVFALVEVFVSLVKALENFGDISHVEDVVTLCRGWQELGLNNVEQVDGSDG